MTEKVTSVEYNAFSGCKGITSIDFSENVTSIGDNAFYSCTNLTTVTLPEGLKTIGNCAFDGCSNISSFFFPDNITHIGGAAFAKEIQLYVKDKTSSLLSLWNAGYKPYLLGTKVILEPPYLTVNSITQTKATIIINNMRSDLLYYFKDQQISDNEIKLVGLFPETNDNVTINVSLEDTDYLLFLKIDYTTLPISPNINVNSTASSIYVTTSYIEGDAEVTSQRLVMNPSDISSRKIYGGTDVEDLTYFASGFDPGRIVASFAYEIIVSNGNNTKRYYTNIINASTAALTLATQQPKIVSIGNAIVAADSNLDDEEENVGFEWRRTDWTDDFASNTGRGAVFEGRMEGYIRNLNTEKLWKYRPYYLSNSGTYYYGDWVGLDPTNTSYFEPTVHTYEKTIIEGNTALVKGYALTGTDKITVQGFKYWKQTSNARGVSRISVPSDAMTIEASGQVMTATLTNLDIGATYNYLSFVTTSEGETFYGELKEFTTGEEEKDGGDADGDGNINASDIVAIVKHIIGNPANGSADVNGDGKVNVADIVKLVNIIMDK